MADLASEVDVAVVGAGAAGLGAARALAGKGVSYLVLEAAHRVGGRAYSEEIAPGVQFDLGCHWMHSASLNPFVAMADEAGFTYTKGTFERNLYRPGRRMDEDEHASYTAFSDACFAAIDRAGEEGRDVSIAEVTDRANRWTGLFDYIVSLYASSDSDQVSTLDLHNYRETQEDWPLKEGYGNLVARLARDMPIELNAAVTQIDWSGRDIRLATAKGTVRAKAIIIAVSTGILGGGDIRFAPELPDWKQQAVADLPLGCHNRICLMLDGNPFGEDHGSGATLVDGDEVPMALRIRPFGHDHVIAITGGRFADWLERAGVEASADLATEKLKRVFGSDIAKHIVRHVVTAWRGDPWVRGAYSAARPGAAHQRATLARPIDERVFFAGEATSSEFFSTAHGAYLSGLAAADAAAKAVKRH